MSRVVFGVSAWSCALESRGLGSGAFPMSTYKFFVLWPIFQQPLGVLNMRFPLCDSTESGVRIISMLYRPDLYVVRTRSQ